MDDDDLDMNKYMNDDDDMDQVKASDYKFMSST